MIQIRKNDFNKYECWSDQVIDLDINFYLKGWGETEIIARGEYVMELTQIIMELEQAKTVCERALLMI